MASIYKREGKPVKDLDSLLIYMMTGTILGARLLKAATASATAVRYAKERFDTGVDNFLEVLDAERTLLDAQDRLARAETGLALGIVNIYKTLGGGWETVKAPEGP